MIPIPTLLAQETQTNPYNNQIELIMKMISIILSISLILSSCTQKKYFLKDNVIYKKIETGIDSQIYKIQSDTLVVGTWGTLKDNGDNLSIKIDATSTILTGFSDIDTKKTENARKLEALSLNKYYFPESSGLLLDSLQQSSIAYVDFRPVFQALSFPVKIRTKLTTPALGDSFPTQVETNISFAFAGGYKISYNKFNAQANYLGLFTDRYSFTPGLFFGLGAVDLQKSNTRNPIITFGRKSLTYSFGVFAVFGFNNLNFGYSFGMDHSTGDGSQGWVYQNKPWHGLTLGVDIIK